MKNACLTTTTHRFSLPLRLRQRGLQSATQSSRQNLPSCKCFLPRMLTLFFSKQRFEQNLAYGFTHYAHVQSCTISLKLNLGWTVDGGERRIIFPWCLHCAVRSGRGSSAACVLRSVWLLKQSSCSSKRCESFLLLVGSHGLTTTLFPLEQVRGAAKMGGRQQRGGKTAYSRMFIWFRLSKFFIFLFYQWLISFGYLVISGMPLSAFRLRLRCAGHGGAIN